MSNLDSTTPSPKTCTKCGQEHPATLEFFRRSRVSGLRGGCRACEASQSRTYYAGHREWFAERWQGYYAEHAETLKDRRRAYYDGHHEESMASCRAWYAEHREERAEYNRIWLAEHVEDRAAYRRANRESGAKDARNRRARKLGNGGTHTTEDILAQYDRQKGRCFYCDEKVGDTYHVDHVMPVILGGSNGPENLVISCPTCNMQKGAKHPQEFAGRLL